MKSRIEKLKEEVEDRSGKLDFESYSPYDIADMLKLYLRELPEPLLTSKLAETFISIYKGETDCRKFMLSLLLDYARSQMGLCKDTTLSLFYGL